MERARGGGLSFSSFARLSSTVGQKRCGLGMTKHAKGATQWKIELGNGSTQAFVQLGCRSNQDGVDGGCSTVLPKIMRFLNWNPRELGNPQGFQTLRDLLAKEEHDVVFL